jgi:hypothetical protein
MSEPPETINQLESHDVVGYFESLRSVFFVKMGTLMMFEGGDLQQHKAISSAAAAMAREMGSDHLARGLAAIGQEVVENIKEDAVTGLHLSAWSIFEQVIKDVVTPDYATQDKLLQADYNRAIFGFSQRERDEIGIFYHFRNAIMHYNGAYHAYRKVDIHYEGRHFLSDGHFGEKIVISPKLALKMADDLERYTMQAWSKVAQPSGR